MKLSEAIRKGCEDTEKCEGYMVPGEKQCCVLGAAAVGVVGWKQAAGAYETKGSSIHSLIMKEFPILRNLVPQEFHPLRLQSAQIFSVIVDRNDKTDTTREMIADEIQAYEEGTFPETWKTIQSN